MRVEAKLLLHAGIGELDHVQLGLLQQELVNTGVYVPVSLGQLLNPAAFTLCWEGPVSPNWAHCSDGVSDVQAGMDVEGAHWEAGVTNKVPFDRGLFIF
jgi:hypothetical protein